MPVEVRQPLFHGRCAVHALWFDLDLIGPDEARRRVLAHWQAGSHLFLAGGGYLLRWPAPRWQQVDTLDALALCQVGHVLGSAPLSQTELATLPAGTVWLVRAGVAQAALPQERLDAAAWLALDAITLCVPLAPPSPPAADAMLAPIALEVVLGAAMPRRNAASIAFERGLALPAPSGQPEVQASGGPDAAAAAPGFVARLLSRWRLGPAAPPAPAARALSSSYLDMVIALFAGGDLAMALSHAVPVGAVDSGGAAQMLPLRRQMSADGTPAWATPLTSAYAALLRSVYRSAFEQLDGAGRVDEAVYVLAGLLQCPREAVAYLEQKQRYGQAARLAEQAKLEAPLAVRLWLLAGELEHAVRLARLHNVFDAAVQLLETNGSVLAAPLRRHWAAYLAERGDLVEAAAVLRSLPDQRAQTLAWLAQAERHGGTLGMRALAFKLALDPATLHESAADITALLAAGGEDGAGLRASLALALLGKGMPAVATSTASWRVAGELLRKVLPERLEGANRLDAEALAALAGLAGGTALHADLPRYRIAPEPHVPPLTERDASLALRLDQRGLLPIHDARCLADGQYLLALGQGGVLRVDRDGRQLAHYPVPAEHLVLSYNGTRALALARRGSQYRISRLDLVTGDAADWLGIDLQHWSGSYDGVSWNVAFERRLAVLDTCAPQQRIVWEVAGLPGEIVGYRDRGDALAVVLRVADGIEQWTYHQPGRQLRQRDWWKSRSLARATHLLPGPPYSSPWPVFVDEQAGTVTLMLREHPLRMPVALAPQAAREVRIDGKAIVFVGSEGDAMCCNVVSLSENAMHVRIALPDALAPGFSLHDARLLVFDRAGRLVDLDCDSGKLRSLCLR
ncbi:bpX6 domain-containing protein [Massilia aquatica]|nr:bpX6 domain-containing protein [Massilia aquatica]